MCSYARILAVGIESGGGGVQKVQFGIMMLSGGSEGKCRRRRVPKSVSLGDAYGLAFELTIWRSLCVHRGVRGGEETAALRGR